MPDDYRTWQRVAGLYPLTSVAFYLGAQGLQQNFQATFDEDISALPVHGRVIRYSPSQGAALSAQEIAAISGLNISHEQLPLPVIPDPATLETLFAQFAPIFEVDTVREEDRIGALRWKDPQTLEVDTRAPTVYHYLSYTRFAGQVCRSSTTRSGFRRAISKGRSTYSVVTLTASHDA